MSRVLKWGGYGIVGLITVLLLAGATVYGASELKVRKAYAVTGSTFTLPTDRASVERGRHVAVIRGCLDCHGEDGGGRVMIDALPVFARLAAPALTPSGRPGSYTAEDWDLAVRHGIGPDGRPLLFMPSHEFAGMSDQDLGALAAYFRSLPPVAAELPPNALGPLARALYLKGDLPLVPAELVDHEAPHLAAIEPAPTAEYGAYLAAGCVGCHGEGFGGGKIPGMPPEAPPAANLTMHETGLAAWTREDFFRALREGRRPDGSEIDPFMPWQATAQMTDLEIEAVWKYLKTVPPAPLGTR